MKITEEAIKEFEQLWLVDHPGQKVDRGQLLEMASRVMSIVKVIYLPQRKAKNDERVS